MSNFGYVGLKDENGVAYGVKHVQYKPRVSAMPYLYDIAEGNVSGHTAWSKVGFNPTVATSEEDLWSAGGLYVFPTSATLQMEVVSSLATADVDVGTILFTGTSDTGGTTTTMLDAGVDFSATAAIGDVIIIDKAGTVPEWGVLTAVANGSVTFANGLSSLGSCATARGYHILDTSAAKGAMAVKIDYLDSTYAAKTEIVILNTNTPVPMVSADTFRVNSFRVIAVGSKATALNMAGGNLSLMKNGGLTYSYITAGYTRARNTMYTVPLGKTLYVTQWAISAATTNNKVESVRCVTRTNAEPGTGFKGQINAFYVYTEVLTTNATNSIEFTVPTKIVAGTDIKVSAIPFGAFTGPVTSVLRGWIE